MGRANDAAAAAAAAVRLYDNHFLIEPMESCAQKLPTADPIRAGAAGFFNDCWLIFAGLAAAPHLAPRRRFARGRPRPRDPVSKSDNAIILPEPSRVDYQISGGGCLWPRRLSQKLICQVYLPLVGSRRRRTKQPLPREDKADKGDRKLWKMKHGFSFLARRCALSS